MSENTTKLEDYRKIRQSQTIVKELGIILKIIGLTIKGLKPFKYYSPIQDVLFQLEDSKVILEIHYNNHKNLLKIQEITDG